jgi:Beta-lactamase
VRDVPVDGTTDPAFASVAEVFRDLLATGQETGAALAGFVDGRQVVDLWGGWADAGHSRPWTPDTLVTTFSVCKPIWALALLRRVADGTVDLDTPVVRYWPEFGAGDKEGATVRHALAHQAGVPVVAEPLAALLTADPRVLPAGLLAEALFPQAVGIDALLEEEATWTLGWRRDGGFVGLGGMGGSSAGMDTERGYALAYTTHRLAGHDRSNACYDALEACLDGVA